MGGKFPTPLTIEVFCLPTLQGQPLFSRASESHKGIKQHKRNISEGVARSDNSWALLLVNHFGILMLIL